MVIALSMVSTGTGESFREGLGTVGVFTRPVADTVWPWSQMGAPLLGMYCWVTSGKGSMQGGLKGLKRLLEECHRKNSKGPAVIFICCDLVSKEGAGHRE